MATRKVESDRADVAARDQHDRSVGELVRLLTAQVSTLARMEVELAKAGLSLRRISWPRAYSRSWDAGASRRQRLSFRAGKRERGRGMDQDPSAIRADIERERRELGETVAALAEKADVKSQAHRKISETRGKKEVAAAVLVIALVRRG